MSILIIVGEENWKNYFRITDYDIQVKSRMFLVYKLIVVHYILQFILHIIIGIGHWIFLNKLYN